jgi:hypothetical protein
MRSGNSVNEMQPAALLRRSYLLRNRLWIFLLAGLALLAFLTTERGLSRAMRMTVKAAPSAEIAQLKPGHAAKVLLELTSVAADGHAEGRVLEKQSETLYRRGATTLQVVFSNDTPMVMGKAADLHRGAVVHVTGTIREDHLLRATQIVILTGYVRIE